MYLEGQWLQTLVRMTEEQFLKLSRGEQIKMLTAFRIKGTFWLTPMAILNGFEEDVDTSNFSSLDMPTSSAGRPLSCTQDSVRGTDIEGDGGTPCTQRYKRKLDNDNVGASSNKVKKT
ncbi:hypothetical protein KC19_VG107300 [Ceratodon purpureus]|uniref:Uncharacterized protein n=1 Tax=Ceratodon purpureus TaxID=3225 RepID=A0A8T0HP62_CERPU|nr:hypothetical protein KC19_VG107300 [Ceratodon purpureus]